MAIDSTVKPVYDSINLVKEKKKDTTLLGSGAIFQSMNSTVNMNLSTIFSLKGVNFYISAACANGSHSIGIGYLLLKQGITTNDFVRRSSGKSIYMHLQVSMDWDILYQGRQSNHGFATIR